MTERELIAALVKVIEDITYDDQGNRYVGWKDDYDVTPMVEPVLSEAKKYLEKP